MAEIEALGIMDEIQFLVSDKLQVVSYKWLSRNYMVSSNAAKRLLQEFVEKYGSGLQIVYTLAGWLKNNPSVYHIRLVSQSKLPEAKEDFDGTCSAQVYSVQACIPKDPAILWNAEFVQAEELFMQPPTVDNCLRDNRFCGVSNSFVKRSAERTPGSLAVPLTKSAVSGTVKGACAQQAAIQQRKVQQLSPDIGLQSSNVVKSIKSENHSRGGHEQGIKPAEDEEKVPHLLADKKKGQNDKSSSGTGGSLASMWGRASTKSKSTCASAETNKSLLNSTASVEAHICAREVDEDCRSDDDGGVNFKRASNGEGSRKRRVVFDYSDEDDDYKDAVSLASPDPPKKQLSASSKASALDKNNLNFDKQKEDNSKVKEGKETNKKSKKECSTMNNGKKSEISPENSSVHAPVKDAGMMNKVHDTGAYSPKRRKVLKTRIDERGREVNEVVWEGEEKETKPETDTAKSTDNSVVNNTANRLPVPKKSPAIGNTAPSNPGGKAGNKKAGNKDPKQGNILSFFKKV